jgi:stage II sporulation protein D
MIDREPTIRVGIIENQPEIRGSFEGQYELPSTIRLTGAFHVRYDNGRVVLYDDEGVEVIRRPEILCRAITGGTFTLHDVTIGLQFHWERKEDQTFEGNVRFVAGENGTTVTINEIGLERYLASVISSEMNPSALGEFLKAHAITSRSWLVAMLEKQSKKSGAGPRTRSARESDSEIIRWYDREDHELFDVCADDHCQRYQGVTKVLTKTAGDAVEATRGVLLIHNDEVCDARYYKACGGLTENFENVWEDTPIPYLSSVSDSAAEYPRIVSEADARAWITSSPEAHCNTTDTKVLQRILPSFDQETTDFFRWRVDYEREELEEILRTRSGIDFGVLSDLIPLRRGASGRIVTLKIVGSKRTVVVGKELEIRRWLSRSHLYSSAFVVETTRDAKGVPLHFTLFGAGWGHGVGLCQIGAAVMAEKGKKAEEIVTHYFRGASLKKLY